MQNYQVKKKFSRILIRNFNRFDKKIKFLGIEILSLLRVYDNFTRHSFGIKLIVISNFPRCAGFILCVLIISWSLNYILNANQKFQKS